jgi:hypothetical protein
MFMIKELFIREGCPLAEKCREGDTEIKNTIHRAKDFLRWQALLP